MAQPDTARLTNPVKDTMKAGGVSLGMTVRLGRSPDIARIAKATGHDFIFIDTQHSIFDLETITAIAHTALAIGVAPLVRVRGIDDPDVSLLLDNGVTGIIYPDVANAAEARKAVDTCKFAPIGKRSVVGGYPHFDYRAVPLTESVPQLNDACLLVCMIETVEGLNNVEAIAAVDGVDVLHVGSNDLLVNMGKPGKFDDPAIVAAQDRVIEAAKAHGKFAGHRRQPGRRSARPPRSAAARSSSPPRPTSAFLPLQPANGRTVYERVSDSPGFRVIWTALSTASASAQAPHVSARKPQPQHSNDRMFAPGLVQHPGGLAPHRAQHRRAARHRSRASRGGEGGGGRPAPRHPGPQRGAVLPTVSRQNRGLCGSVRIPLSGGGAL